MNLVTKLNRIAKNAGGALKKKLKDNKRLNEMAAAAMAERYPQGWSQNAYHMGEMTKIKKQLKKKK